VSKTTTTPATLHGDRVLAVTDARATRRPHVWFLLCERDCRRLLAGVVPQTLKRMARRALLDPLTPDGMTAIRRDARRRKQER